MFGFFWVGRYRQPANMSMSLFQLRPGSTALTTPFANKDQAAQFLERELLLTLRENQDKSLAESIDDPGKWLAARSARIRNIIKGGPSGLKDDKDQDIPEPGLDEIYRKYIERYAAVYPVDQAVARATEDIRPLFEARMRQMEVEFPGASLIMPKLSAQAQEYSNKSALADAVISHDQYKAYRRAKKASKKSKK